MKLFKILILFIVTGLLSCQSQVKFDQTKWRFKEDPAFPPQLRKAMLGDLLANYKLTTMSHPQVISLLGEPDYSDDSTLSYKIVEDYGKDIDPIYIETLEILLHKNKTVKEVKLQEWKK